jgi:Gas vesicle synthesis protein GvpO
MAEQAEARRKRADERRQRRSQDAKPREGHDQATSSPQSQAFAAARKAAGTAASAALAGALAGGLKAVVDRRRRSPDEASPSPEQPSAGGDNEQPEEASEQHQDQAEDMAEPEEEQVQTARDGAEQQRNEPRQGASSAEVAKMIERARSHLRELFGEEPESVSGISSSNGTWTVALEVVEVRRIPETTDVLASYDVALDDEGDLVRLERRRRYFRSQVEEGR